VFLLEAGLVALTRAEENGRELIVGLRSPGWVLGAASAILEEPYPASVVTLRPSRVHVLPAALFVRAIRSKAGRLAWSLLEQHSRDLHDQIRRLSVVTLVPRVERLQDYFWSASNADGAGKRPVRLPFYHLDLARYINVNPASGPSIPRTRKGRPPPHPRRRLRSRPFASLAPGRRGLTPRWMNLDSFLDESRFIGE
jgi:CRP-like cAMP-binding protein